MRIEISNMLHQLKTMGIAKSKVEFDLGFSNGLLGKAAKGFTKLSIEKLSELIAYHQKHYTLKPDVASLKETIPTLKVASELPLKPVIDNDCRQAKDYCKENGLELAQLVNFHRTAIAEESKKKKTVKEKKEEERSSGGSMTYFQKRQKGLL